MVALKPLYVPAGAAPKSRQVNAMTHRVNRRTGQALRAAPTLSQSPWMPWSDGLAAKYVTHALGDLPFT